jgi:anti-sigma B factor antagonist
MEEAIRRHAREGTPAVVVNLADVPSVDLVGLGALVDGYRTMRIAGGELTLANLTTRIHALIVITRLLTVFQTFDTVEEAISRSAPMPRAAGGAPSALALDGIQRFLRRA